MSNQQHFAQGYSTQQQQKPVPKPNTRFNSGSPRLKMVEPVKTQVSLNPVPRFNSNNEPRRQQTSQNNTTHPVPTLNYQTHQVSGSGLQSYPSGLEPQTIVPGALESDEPQHQMNQYLLTDNDLKKPPVSIFQEEIYNLPSKQQREACVLFDTLKWIEDEPDDEGLSGPRTLIYFSRKQADIKTKTALRERKSKHDAVNSDFSNLFAQGTRRIGVSPDHNQLAILRNSFEIAIYNRKKDQLSIIKGLSRTNFVGKNLDIDPFQTDQYEFSEAHIKEKFQLFINNDASTIVVFCQVNNSAWVWFKNNSEGPEVLKSFTELKKQEEKIQIKKEKQASDPTRLFRSNSATKERPKEQERSQSRLKRLFSFEFLKPSSSRSNSQSKTNQSNDKLDKINMVHPEKSNSKQSQFKPKEIIMPVGMWTNITLNNMVIEEEISESLCQAQAVKFYQNDPMSNGIPYVFGVRGEASKIIPMREETVFTQVCMYESETYFKYIESELVSAPENLQNENQQPVIQIDSSKRILLISQQTIDSHAMNRGGIFYESSFLVSEKTTKMTQIEHSGLLDDNQNVNSEVNLILRPDNQNSLLAIVINSQHIFYCQVLFCNMKTNFMTSMQLFNFQQQSESPPLDKKGKANLIVDDVQWTQNDAFLLLMFSTGALAVLPRLGSQLLSVFNPTLANVQRKEASLFEQYKLPRMFNQLIISSEVQQHIKKLKGDVKQRFKLQMHPFDLAFTVYDGQVAFVMRMELEPELMELFDRQNMSYYFMRFCFSMPKLSVDPDILEKIPKLLTNKLPLFEVEKNRDETPQMSPDQRLMTASHITPFEMEDKRMETVQSFDAEFDDEPEIVLLNFKNLLFSFRWNKNITFNYLQWLITVVNDCVHFFLKKSEPIYAFHVLVLAEFYIKKVLHQSDNQSNLFDIGTKQKRKSRKHKKKVDQTDHLTKFIQQTLRLCDPTQEIYEYQPGHPNAKCNKEKKCLKVNKKLKLVSDFFDKMPQGSVHGSFSNNFMFEKSYISLIFYSLIQFRNYQASNFNIINLLFACYIVQKYLCKRFGSSIKQVNKLMEHNQLALERTDEIDMFFGKTGNNRLCKLAPHAQVYFYWMSKVMKVSNCFHSRFFEENNLMYFTRISYSNVLDEKAKLDSNEDNTDLLHDVTPVMLMVFSLQRGGIKPCCKILLQQAETMSKAAKQPEGCRIPTQCYGKSLALLTYYIQINLTEDSKTEYIPTLHGLIQSVGRSAVNLDKKSPINCISQHDKSLQLAFKSGPRKKNFLKKLLRMLEIENDVKLFRLIAVLQFSLGNVQQGCKILNRVCLNSYQSTSPCDLLIFQIQMLCSTLKQLSKVFQHHKESLKDFDISNVQSIPILQSTTERLNVFHMLKLCYQTLSNTFLKVCQMMNNHCQLSSLIWTMCDMMQPGFANTIKQQVAVRAIKQMRQIIKIRQQKVQQVQKTSKNQSKQESVLEKYKLAKTFLSKTIPLFEQTIDFCLSDKKELQGRFLQQLEVFLVCFQDQSWPQFQLNQLILDQLPKLAKIIHYLKTMSQAKEYDKEIQALSKKLVLDELMKSSNKLSIDKKLVQSLLGFLGMINISSLVQAQQYIAKNIHVLSYLLTHGDSTAYDHDNIELLEAICSLNYPKLNVDNQKLVQQLTEKVQKMDLNNQRIKLVHDLLLSQIKNESLPLETIVKYCSEQSKKWLISSLMEQNQMSKLNESLDLTAFADLVWECKQNFETKELITFCNSLDVPSFYKKAHDQSNIQKCNLIHTFVQAHKQFGLPLETSLFYRGSCFEQRESNIFGFTKEEIEPFMKEQDSVEDLMQQTVLIVEKTALQAKRNLNFESEVQDTFFNANNQAKPLQPVQKFVVENLNDRSVLNNQEQKEQESEPEQMSLQGQESARFFSPLESEVVQKKEEVRKSLVIDLKKLSRISKLTLRKNSTRRIVSITHVNQQDSTAHKFKQPVTGAPLPPKPFYGGKKKMTKELACTTFSKIVLKDVKLCFKIWLEKVYAKKDHREAFNLLALKKNKDLQKFTIKNPKKLYGKKRLDNESLKLVQQNTLKEQSKIQPAVKIVPFELLNVKRVAPIDAEKPADKIMGQIMGIQKIQVVSQIEKVPIVLNQKTKIQLMKNIMKQVDAVNLEAQKLKRDYERTLQ